MCTIVENNKNHVPTKERGFLLGKLAVVEGVVFAAQCHEFIVGTDFLDVAVFHVENHVGIQNGRQAMGNDKAGAALHEFCHGLLDEHLGVGVNVGGGFVQNHDFRVGSDGARNREKLTFPLGNVLRALGKYHVIAARQGFDKVVGASRLGGGDDFALWHVLFRIADVISDAAFKEPGVLEDHAKAVAQFGAAHLFCVDTVDGDAAIADLVEAHE